MSAAPAKPKLESAGAFSPTVWADSAYECPHCGREQAVKTYVANLGAARVELRQCLVCSNIQLSMAFNWRGSTIPAKSAQLFPRARVRPSKIFESVPNEILSSYTEACRLVGVHTGASGAYCRRALELILDGMGYRAKSLLQSIDLAKSEVDLDRRLPRALLQRLDFIKEIGNFALHVRRDSSLVIVDIDPAEVEACIQAIEAILTYVFEDPASAVAETEALNLKLSAASKPLIEVPDLPGALWDAAAAMAPIEPAA